MTLDLNLHAVLGELEFDQVDSNWTQIQGAVNTLLNSGNLDNFSATTDPGSGNDTSQGYQPGSRWYNTTSGDFFLCVDATVGAAVWVLQSVVSGELGSAAFSDVTAGPYDTTPERVLRVQNWGIGQQINGPTDGLSFPSVRVTTILPIGDTAAYILLCRQSSLINPGSGVAGVLNAYHLGGGIQPLRRQTSFTALVSIGLSGSNLYGRLLVLGETLPISIRLKTVTYNTESWWCIEVPAVATTNSRPHCATFSGDAPSTMADDFQIVEAADVTDVADIPNEGSTVAVAGQLLYHQGNALGTVTQVSGVPTGAIIQQGNNANGRFTRFADGTQICYATIEVNTSWATNGALYRSANTNWSFPALFSADVVCSGSGNSNTLLGVSFNSPSVSGVSLAVHSVDNSPSFPINCRLIAIGRWF